MQTALIINLDIKICDYLTTVEGVFTADIARLKVIINIFIKVFQEIRSTKILM